MLRPRWSVAPARERLALERELLAPLPAARRHAAAHGGDEPRRAAPPRACIRRRSEKRLVMVPGPEAQAKVDALLAQHGLAPKGFLQVHPTSRWLFKAWTEERNAELLQLPREATGTASCSPARPMPASRRSSKRILERAGAAVTDLSGQLTLREMGALTARARLFFGVDSAPMHIAAAMGTPVVALFGPSGEHEWGPWMVPHRVVASDHSVPPVRQRRLRRRQGERMPHAAAGRRACTRRSTSFSRSREPDHPGARRERPRAWPSCAAASMPSAAPSASCSRPSRRSPRRAPPSPSSRAAGPTATARRSCVDPFYVGSLWRDRGFARAVVRGALAAPLRPRAVPRAHRLLRRLPRRRRRARGMARAARARPVAHRAARHAPCARITATSSPRSARSSPRRACKAVICNSEMVRGEIARRFATPAEKLVLIRNAVDGARFHPGLRDEIRRGRAPAARRFPRERGRASPSWARASSARAWSRSCARSRARREPAWAVVVGQGQARRALRGALRAAGHRRARALRGRASPTCVPTSRPPTPSCCRRSTTRSPTPRSRRWRAGLPVVTSAKCGAAEILAEGETGFVRDALDVAGPRRLPRPARPGDRRAAWAPPPATPWRPSRPRPWAREYLALYERLLAGKLG